MVSNSNSAPVNGKNFSIFDEFEEAISKNYFKLILSIQNGHQPLKQTSNQLSYIYYIKHEVIMSDQVSISTFRTRSFIVISLS